ncbi:hypothetical protein AVEN_185645-1 [Araneus ventricosus]|uniref:Uncharacterized protein n=1 Tax=Araneus ventricosus TaxID=182803 RepID=A0A4Y2RJA1_ARAVE|nr:hypothetical protein AVEN_185645-1 [Araneus ventricosus]
MFIQTVTQGSEFCLPQEDEIHQRKTTTDKIKFGSRTLEKIILGDSLISKNNIFYQDMKKSTFLTECFADFITLIEGEGFSNRPKIMPSSTVLLTPHRIKHAWMHVLTMPWISQRKNTMRKLETVIWIDSVLQYSKHCVALCGYPLVMLSSSLLEYSEFSWFFRMFYNASLMIGYLNPCHLLLDKILAWYCKHYVISAIREDFFRLDVLDDTTYFLYHHQNQLSNVDPSVVQDREDHPEDKLQSDVFESEEGYEQGNLLCPEYERIRMLTELLSNSRKKLNFHAIVGNTENLQQEIVSISNNYGKALPVVNKSYILTQLNTALRLQSIPWRLKWLCMMSGSK